MIRCSLVSGKKKAKRKPLTELYAKGHFTEGRSELQKELQRHSEEVYTDMEETKEAQENRIEYFWKKGNQQFTEEARNVDITVDLVLHARAKLSENKVNGPEDAIVSEIVKRLPMEKIHTITRCFQEGGEVGVLEEARCSPDQRDEKLQSSSSHVGDVEVVRIMHLATFGERKEARKMEEATYWWIGWNKLPTLASNDDECDTETLGVAGGKESCDEIRYGGKTNTVFG